MHIYNVCGEFEDIYKDIYILREWPCENVFHLTIECTIVKSKLK